MGYSKASGKKFREHLIAARDLIMSAEGTFCEGRFDLQTTATAIRVSLQLVATELLRAMQELGKLEGEHGVGGGAADRGKRGG